MTSPSAPDEPEDEAMREHRFQRHWYARLVLNYARANPNGEPIPIVSRGTDYWDARSKSGWDE